MTNKTRNLIAAVAATIILHPVLAQPGLELPVPDKPMVGRLCPDFSLKDVTHHEKSEVILEDFKGKWLFLDFWSTTCRTCIDRFPKMNDFQAQFKDMISVVMVGHWDRHNRNIKTLFEKLRQHHKLELVSAYDSAIFKNWDIHTLPRIVIVDPDGYVRVITDGRDMTAEKIQALLAREAVWFYNSDRERPDFVPATDKGLPTKETISNSFLNLWNGEKQAVPTYIQRYLDNVDRRSFRSTMVTLADLFNYAYVGQCTVTSSDSLFGLYHPVPIVESENNSLFDVDPTPDAERGFYNYRLVLPVPMATVQMVMTAMQEDLKRAFQLEASLQTRPISTWSLISVKRTKNLRTKDTKTAEADFRTANAVTGLTLLNVSIRKLLIALWSLDQSNGPAYVDNSGIDYNIDIHLNGPLLTIDDYRRELNKSGLDLVRTTREMQVLVVKDSR